MPWPPASVRYRPARAFGERVRELRLDRGLSQEALAERAGLSRNYVGDVERGMKNLSLYNLLRIAKALGVDAGLLVTRLEP